MLTTKSNYSLEIISHHSKFNEKSLRKYYVDGIETVGAWGDEPFEIRFKNHTSQKVQVKLSLDGTDILTGKPADTQASSDMWVVNGYDTLSLKAWPETNNGGASFVFTSADNSVALHTHGDMSCRGIIAAAVFTEGHVEPIRYNPPIIVKEHHYHPYPTYPYYYPPVDVIYPNTYPIWINNTIGTCDGLNGGITYTANNFGTMVPQSVSSASFDCNFVGGPAAASGAETFGSTLDEVSDSRGLETLVSIGAGEHVDQKITYVTGLIKPIFSETIRVKYVWWDELVAKLRTETKAQVQPSGFPGDKQKNIDLGKIPRIGSVKRIVAEQPQAQVFERV